MKMLLKKLLSVLLTLTLLVALAPAAMAAETLLQVNLSGLYATHDGNYQSVAVSGTFEVYQNEQFVGTLNVTPAGENTIALASAENVRLAPVMASIPDELQLNEYGYGVAISEGRLNIAPVTAYANAGLFIVEAGAQASFDLLDAEEEIALSFETDETGLYVQEIAIPAGQYTLRMIDTVGAMWPDQAVEILTYAGEASVLKILPPEGLVQPTATPEPTATPTEAPTATPEPTAVPTEVPTATPEPTAVPTGVPMATPEPTATPTEAPTATPEPTATPTEAPTATPEPTATPTEAPTATPVPTDGDLLLSIEGASKKVGYSVFNGQTMVAQGEMSAAAPVRLDNLTQGEYLVTLNLPDDLAVVGLNGNETIQRGVVLWMAAVYAMQENSYVVELSDTGSVIVALENVAATQVLAYRGNESHPMALNENGEYEATSLLPGRYTISISLPAGDYEYDSNRWRMDANADGTYTALAYADIMTNSTAMLPSIVRHQLGVVSGTVQDANGKALKGAQVTVYDAAGELAATVQSDVQGAWQVESLPYGAYSVQYASEGRALPANSFDLTMENRTVTLAATAATPAKISVRAFIDENNNGTAAKQEGSLKGVEVSLVDENGLAVATGVTNEDGYVTLAALAGQYRLRATAPVDWGFGVRADELAHTRSIMDETPERTQESEMITLVAGETLDAGIGMLHMGIVRGTIWNDLNADGLWQEDEPGIPGVRMTIHGGRGDRMLETVTDENGVYEFRQVMKGSHYLNCYVPDELVLTGKVRGDVEKRSRLTLEADRVGEIELQVGRGEVVDNYNIGMMKGVIIEGICFLDNNHNGYFDEGEKPLAGVEMRLARQSNNVLLQHVVSDENGRYHFVGQRGSTFTIRATLPKGWVFSQAVEGEGGNRFAPDGQKNERRLTDITIDHGGYAEINLGAITYSDISGRVYYDENFSGAWENGEAYGQSFKVTLLNEKGEQLNTVKAEWDGRFQFTNLTPGVYYLSMKPADGYAFTTLGADNVMRTLSDGSGLSRALHLEMGNDITNAGIGMIVPAEVSGAVFADYNDNDLQDAEEKGLAGTKVSLMNEAGEAYGVTIDESGEFCFNAVMPGRYYLQYELPAGGLFTAVVPGGNTVQGENGIGTGEWFNVEVGGSYAAPLCGGLVLSDITGVIFGDANGNSIWDADETPVSGAMVSLIPMRSDLPSFTIVTAADGSFAMNDLRPDSYILTVTCPGEYVISRLSDVKMPVQNGLHTQTVTFQLEMGTQWLDQKLGCVIPASWTGEAWLDENYDGLRGAEEAPAVGETIELRDADSGEVVMSVLTDENGVFTIKGIAPGEYELVHPLDEGSLLPKEGSCDFTSEGTVMTTGRVMIQQNNAKSGTALCVVRTTEISGAVLFEQYSGVTPIAGAVLHLMDANGSVLAEVVTAEDGAYAFKGLMPAEYQVDVTVPAGYVLVESSDTHLAERNLSTFVLEANSQYGVSDIIPLKMAGHRRDMDVILVLPGRLGDKVWLDLNGNGLQDGEEGGIPGVTIELMRGDRLMATTVSDQYGYYVFEDLYPTEYTLRVTWPSEVLPTQLRTDIQQISSVLQEDGLSIPVVVESNKANYAADLGFVLVEEGKLPAGYGEGEKQNWKH